MTFFTDTEKVSLVEYILSRSIPDFDKLDAGVKTEYFYNLAPNAIPILNRLPKKYSKKDLEENPIDYHATATETLLILYRRQVGESMTDSAILEKIDPTAIDQVSFIQQNMTYLILEIIELYEIETIASNFDSFDFNKELEKLFDND